MFKNEIKNTAILLSLITSSFYIFGLTYYQGYLGYWGIEDSLFPLAFEQTLFQGFVGVSHLSLKITLQLLLFLVVVWLVVVAFSAFSIFTKFSQKSEDLISTWLTRQTNDSLSINRLESMATTITKMEKDKSVKFVSNLVVMTNSFLIGFISIIFLLFAAQYLGNAAAETNFKKFKENGYRKIDIVHKTLGTLKGTTILCNESYCAYLIDGTISTFPLSDIVYQKSTPIGT